MSKYWFTDKVVYPKFDITSYVWPEWMREESKEIQEFNHLPDDVKWNKIFPLSE